MQRMAKSWFFVLSLVPMVAGAQASEKDRLAGFAEHQNNQAQFEKARQQGERAHLERDEQWETAKDRDLADYIKRKFKKGMTEDGPEARKDEAEKKKYEAEYEQARKDYEIKRTQQAQRIVRGQGLPTEEEEYGLIETRPRYDYKKRSDFGAPSRYGKPGSSSSSSGRGSGGSGGGFTPPPFQDSGSDGGAFPPPPTFDDFGGEGDGGFVPAPNMEDYGDIPPPPPPPPTFGEDFGGFNPDFPPPPPPPPFGESY